jgi:chemotaxis protein MotB
MHRGTNPWPAFVDLFSALLIAAFAGFTMLSGAYQHELEVYIARTQELEKIRRKADAIADQLKEFLDSEVIKHIVRRCGDDICIDLYIHFALNKDTIEDVSELGELENVCKIIKNGLDRLPVANRKDIELVIEGHTDSQQISEPTDPRTRYLFNWNLSSRRATSVLYEFKKCGLAPPDYQIVAIGYADSMPLCTDPTEDCYAKNRRTTLRLRVDTQRIEDRLKEQLR